MRPVGTQRPAERFRERKINPFYEPNHKKHKHVMKSIKQLLKAETEFTNKHLTRSQQIKVGAIVSLAMIMVTLYFILKYAN